MKKLNIFLSTLLVLLLAVASTGCYMIQGQKMRKVKGTYELTSYTRTNGKTNKVTDYVETYGYKVYLVVTGSGEGYCVFDSNDCEPYYYPCTLSYSYNQDNSSLVEYVTYTYVQTTQKFGVTKDGLNFSRPVVKLSDTIYSDGISVSWKRVSGDTDLSYAEEQLGELALYDASSDYNGQ